MEQQRATAGWSFFDRIYCISLKNRDDRRAIAASVFKRVGLSQRVEFVLVEPHPVNSEQGIFESHMRCVRKGLDAGADTILIFEDDVQFERFSPQRIKACTEFLRGCDHWKILFLGAMVQASRTTASPAVRKVSFRCLSHAYALHRHYAKQLLAQVWQGKPYDGVLGHLKDDRDGVYACSPMIAFQSDAATDNVNLHWLDTIRRWCGGLRRIQKANEWYHRHRLLIWALHVVIPVVVLWFVFWN